MTREEVIRLACESGSAAMLAAEEFPHLTAVFERFASLVRQQTLEQASTACYVVGYEIAAMGDPATPSGQVVKKCAEAILELGIKP